MLLRGRGGLCCFHANPDKAAELGRNGGRHPKQTYEQATEHIAPPESAADVRRMLAETMAEVKAGKMDPKVANTVAYVATSTSSPSTRGGFGINHGPAISSAKSHVSPNRYFPSSTLTTSRLRAHNARGEPSSA